MTNFWIVCCTPCVCILHENHKNLTNHLSKETSIFIFLCQIHLINTLRNGPEKEHTEMLKQILILIVLSFAGNSEAAIPQKVIIYLKQSRPFSKRQNTGWSDNWIGYNGGMSELFTFFLKTRFSSKNPHLITYLRCGKQAFPATKHEKTRSISFST